MHVLLVESHPGLGRQAEDDLARAGHDVVRCVGAEASGRCAGLDDAEACPLDRHEIAVAVLAHVGDEFRPAEHGVLCAARHRIPVVAATDSVGALSMAGVITPTHGELTDAVERAAEDGTRRAAAVSRELLALGVVRRDELDGDDPAVAVGVRCDPHGAGTGRLDLTIWLREGDPREATIARVSAAALRRHDRHAGVIDVHVRRLNGGSPVGV